MSLPKAAAPPPLEPGDHLTRAEFERRYEALPNGRKAELIEGVVFMPSPVPLLQHGSPHADLITWLSHYRASLPECASETIPRCVWTWRTNRSRMRS